MISWPVSTCCVGHERAFGSCSEVPYTLRLDALEVVSSNVGAVVFKALEHLCIGLPYGPAVCQNMNSPDLLSKE